MSIIYISSFFIASLVIFWQGIVELRPCLLDLAGIAEDAMRLGEVCNIHGAFAASEENMLRLLKLAEVRLLVLNKLFNFMVCLTHFTAEDWTRYEIRFTYWSITHLLLHSEGFVLGTHSLQILLPLARLQIDLHIV